MKKIQYRTIFTSSKFKNQYIELKKTKRNTSKSAKLRFFT
jgi:hypothetical protein